MPDNTTQNTQGAQIISSGTNGLGNQWQTFQSDGGGRGYRYNNRDGTAYQKNTDGSTLFDNGRGFQQYTSPSGDTSNGYYRR